VGRPIKPLRKDLDRVPDGDDIRLIPGFGSVYYHHATEFVIWAWFSSAARSKRHLFIPKYRFLQEVKSLLQCHKSFATKVLKKGEQLGFWKELRHHRRLYQDKMGRSRYTTMIVLKSEVQMRDEVFKQYGVRKRSYLSISREELSYGDKYLKYFISFPAIIGYRSDRVNLWYTAKGTNTCYHTAGKIRRYFRNEGVIEVKRQYKLVKSYSNFLSRTPNLPRNLEEASQQERRRLRGLYFENLDGSRVYREERPKIIMLHPRWFPIVSMHNKYTTLLRRVSVNKNVKYGCYQIRFDLGPDSSKNFSHAERAKNSCRNAVENLIHSKTDHKKSFFVDFKELLSTAQFGLFQECRLGEIRLENMIINVDKVQGKYPFYPTAYELQSFINTCRNALKNFEANKKKTLASLAQLRKEKRSGKSRLQQEQTIQKISYYTHLAALHHLVYTSLRQGLGGDMEITPTTQLAKAA
jgi:hypothetical protein